MRNRACAVCASVLALFGGAIAGPSAAQGQPSQPERGSTQDPALRSYYAGNGLLARGLDELAVQEYRDFLRDHADHEKAPLARYGLGVALFRLGRSADAVEALTPVAQSRGFASFEFAAEVDLVLGQAHLALGQFDKSAAALSDLLERFDSHKSAADAWALLVEALHRAGEHEQAAKVGARYINRFAGSGALDREELFRGLSEMALSRYADAGARFAGILQRSSEGAYANQAALLRAQCLHRTGALADAASLYRKVIEAGDRALLPDALLGLASAAQQSGDLSQTGQLLDRLLREFPESDLVGEATTLRARAYIEQDQPRQAERLLERAVAREVGPQDEALYWLGKAHLRQGENKQAAERFAQTLERFPHSALAPMAQYDLAVALDRAGRSEDAARALDAFLSANPEHELTADALYLRAAIAHDAGEFDRSDSLLARLLADQPKAKLAVAASFLQIENAYLAGDMASAAKRAQAFLAAHPQDEQAPAATFRLGAALYRSGDLDAAQRALARVAAGADTNEAFRPALLMLGDIAFAQQRYADAERALRDFLRFGPEQAGADDALLKLGLSLERTDRPAEALDLFDRLLEGFADSPHRLQALFERGQALAALDRDDEAERAFEQTLKVGGEDSRFAALSLNHLGAIAQRRGQSDKAADLFARAAGAAHDADSDTASAVASAALRRRAEALFAEERFDEAAKAFDAFLDGRDDHPDAPRARAQRAISLSRAGDNKNAVVALAQVRARDAGAIGADLLAAVIYEHAWSLRSLGQTDDAKAAFHDLLSLSPEPSVDLKAHGLVELAELEMDAERFAEAADLLRDARALGASTAGRDAIDADLMRAAAYRLGVCEFRLNRYDEAARVMDEYLKDAAPGRLAESAALIAGESHHQQGRHAQAVERFQAVLDAKDAPADDQATALLRLGESLAALQRWTDSERAFAAYLDRFADQPLWFQAQFGVGFARENRGRFDDAIAAYRKVIDQHEGETAARAQFQIGECLFAQKQYADAARELLKVDILYAYPEWSAAALYEAGRCFEALEQPAEARKNFNQVVERFGDTNWGRLARGRLAAQPARGIPGGE